MEKDLWIQALWPALSGFVTGTVGALSDKAEIDRLSSELTTQRDYRNSPILRAALKAGRPLRTVLTAAKGGGPSGAAVGYLLNHAATHEPPRKQKDPREMTVEELRRYYAPLRDYKRDIYDPRDPRNR